MEDRNEIIKLGEAWFQEDSKHRDVVIIVSDGTNLQCGTSSNAAAIANMLLNVMPDSAELCEGVKLAAKHYDSVADVLRKDEAKPDGKKALS